MNPIKNAQDKINRRKCTSHPQLAQTVQQTQDSTTTPSPISPTASPIKSNLYAQLDSPSSIQPKSVLVNAPPIRAKKLRHRRCGSGSFQTSKSSPGRDRKIHSEPNDTKILVSTETQTDAMDVSETDASSPVHCIQGTTARRITMCLREDETTQKTTISYIKPHIISGETVDELTPTSPINGNKSMTNSGVSIYRDACSSPDLINDVMNSNERLDTRDCSDGDNLERLERKVTQFVTDKGRLHENGNSIDDSITKYSKKRSFVSVTDSPDCGKFSRVGSAHSHHSQTRRESHDDERCNDSWTDEDGEDNDDYPYSLRRKR